MKQKAIHASTVVFGVYIMIVVPLFLIFAPSALLETTQDFSFYFSVLSLLLVLRLSSVLFVTYAFINGYDTYTSLKRIQVLTLSLPSLTFSLFLLSRAYHVLLAVASLESLCVRSSGRASDE